MWPSSPNAIPAGVPKKDTPMTNNVTVPNDPAGRRYGKPH